MNGMRMFTQAMGKAMGQMSIIRHTMKERERGREKQRERGRKNEQVECVTGRLKIWRGGKRYKLSETLRRCRAVERGSRGICDE